MGSVNIKNIGGSLTSDPLCYLLDINSFRVLLDCGWNENMEEVDVAPIIDIFQNGVNCIILSHPDVLYIGSLPLFVKKFGYKGPIYGTSLTFKFGRVFLRDILKTRLSEGLPIPYSIESLEKTFENVCHLKYHQHKHIEMKTFESEQCYCEIIAYTSGSNLGGATWRITINGEHILYAPCYSILNEECLDFSDSYCNTFANQYDRQRVMNESLFRPSAFITFVPNLHEVGNSKQNLMDDVISILKSQGNVLIPSESLSRLIDIAIIFERYWLKKQLPYSLIMLTNYGDTFKQMLNCIKTETYDYNKKSFNSTLMKKRLIPSKYMSTDPLCSGWIKLFNSTKDLENLPRGPKVIITTPFNLRFGYSKKIFVAWAHDPRNAVIFLSNLTETIPGSESFLSYKNSLKPFISIETHSNSFIDENNFSNYFKYMETRGNKNKIQPLNKMKLFKQKFGLIINKTLVSALKSIFINYKDYINVKNKKRVTWRDRVQIDGFMADSSLPFPVFTFLENEYLAWDNFGQLELPNKKQKFCRSKVSYFDYDLKFSKKNLKTKIKDLLFSHAKPEYSIDKKQNIIQLHCILQMHLIIIDHSASINKIKNLITKSILPRKVLIARGGRKDKSEFQKILYNELKYGQDLEISLFEKGHKVELTPKSFPYKIKIGYETLESFQRINQTKAEISLLRGAITFSDDCKAIRLKLKSLGNGIIPKNYVVLGNPAALEIYSALVKIGIKIHVTTSGIYIPKAELIIKTNLLNNLKKRPFEMLENSTPFIFFDGPFSFEYIKIKEILDEFFKVKLF